MRKSQETSNIDIKRGPVNEISPATNSLTSSLSGSIQENLAATGKWEKTAAAAGEQLDSIETQLLNELSKADPDEGKVQKLEITYKRAQRVYETIRELISSMHETMMRGIQALRAG